MGKWRCLLEFAIVECHLRCNGSVSLSSTGSQCYHRKIKSDIIFCINICRCSSCRIHITPIKFSCSVFDSIVFTISIYWNNTQIMMLLLIDWDWTCPWMLRHKYSRHPAVRCVYYFIKITKADGARVAVDILLKLKGNEAWQNLIWKHAVRIVVETMWLILMDKSSSLLIQQPVS